MQFTPPGVASFNPFGPGLSQHARLITLQSAQTQGQDAELPQTLVVERFTGFEAVNALFCFDIDALSVSTHLDLQSFIGGELSLRLLQADGSQRTWHGYCTQAHWLGSDGGTTRYRLRLEPFLAFLRERRDSFIFQDQTAQQTITQLLGDYPQANFQWDTTQSLQQRPICTQYRESDLDFLTRLLASEGLSWRFVHDQDGPDHPASPGSPGNNTSNTSNSPSSLRAHHQMVIFDAAAQAPTMPGGYDSIRFHRVRATESTDAITDWRAQRRLQPNAVTRASWDPTQLLALSAQEASRPLTTSPSSDSAAALPTLEIFDGSGERHLADAAQASTHVRLQLQALELGRQTFQGTGAVRQLAAGHSFALTQHDSYAEDGTQNAFTVLRIEHAAVNNLQAGMLDVLSIKTASSAYATSASSSTFDSNQSLTDQDALANLDNLAPGTYRNRFSAVRQSVPIVPRATAQRRAPTALGPQTALVVGLTGNGDSSITTERDHRIKIQFPWQRGQAPVAGGLHDSGSPATAGPAGPADPGNAPGNDASGTWVRVAEALAGPNWGSQFTPRIGSEVLVNFIEGDMDRPLVVGQLYNGADLPPFSAGVDSGVNHAGVVSGLHSQG
ncbi:MAG: contractile injection system protein, VgrG/Pvc8 family, partial [Rhodoferax sp.]|uniref:type VI secretion system Vgr family protein n=1 Tax=Rhodoferax sp. TaxID=50421 RepID=UPI0032664DEF